MNCKFFKMAKLKAELDEFDLLGCGFDDLAMLSGKFDELDKLRMSWIS